MSAQTCMCCSRRAIYGNFCTKTCAANWAIRATTNFVYCSECDDWFQPDKSKPNFCICEHTCEHAYLKQAFGNGGNKREWPRAKCKYCGTVIDNPLMVQEDG